MPKDKVDDKPEHRNPTGGFYIECEQDVLGVMYLNHLAIGLIIFLSLQAKLSDSDKI
ncbi:MAG: hypothetical protein ACI9N3_001664 [Colwellia sp.]|jgi:hypothetical protein